MATWVEQVSRNGLTCAGRANNVSGKSFHTGELHDKAVKSSLAAPNLPNGSPFKVSLAQAHREAAKPVRLRCVRALLPAVPRVLVVPGHQYVRNTCIPAYSLASLALAITPAPSCFIIDP